MSPHQLNDLLGEMLLAFAAEALPIVVALRGPRTVRAISAAGPIIRPTIALFTALAITNVAAADGTTPGIRGGMVRHPPARVQRIDLHSSPYRGGLRPVDALAVIFLVPCLIVTAILRWPTAWQALRRRWTIVRHERLVSHRLQQAATAATSASGTITWQRQETVDISHHMVCSDPNP